MRACNLSSLPKSGELSAADILKDAQVDSRNCYQCGKCSAGCPVAPNADMGPREIMRNLQLGIVDKVINSTMPWMCASCGLCSARCPQNIDMPNLMLACRRASSQSGKAAIPEVAKFNNLFIDGVKRLGHSDEAILAARYNLSSGHLFQDALNAPKMMELGMISPGFEKSENANEIASIIERAKNHDSNNTNSEGGKQ